MEKSAAFNVKTIRSDSRHYLIEAELNDPNILLSSSHVNHIIKSNFEKYFGTVEASNLKLQIDEQGSNKFIVSTNCQNAVALRAAILFPPPKFSNIRNLHVISESSFVQPLIHDSRLFFAPLI